MWLVSLLALLLCPFLGGPTLECYCCCCEYAPVVRRGGVIIILFKREREKMLQDISPVNALDFLKPFSCVVYFMSHRICCIYCFCHLIKRMIFTAGGGSSSSNDSGHFIVAALTERLLWCIIATIQVKSSCMQCVIKVGHWGLMSFISIPIAGLNVYVIGGTG